MQKLKGLTLLEVVLVLAVIGIMLSLTVHYFTVVSTNEQVTRAVTQIQTLTKASYQWLQAQRQIDFGSSTNPIDIGKLQQAGLIDMVDMTDPWGGSISVQAAADPAYVRITLTNVSEKTCKNLQRRLGAIAGDRQGCEQQSYYVDL